jgi:hypothetical protein
MPRRRRVNRASLRALHQSLEQALAQPEEEDDDEADGEEEEDEEEEEEESGLGQRGLAVNTAFLGRLLGSLSRTNTRVERGIAEGAVANERRANLAARRRDGEARIRRIAAACRLRVEVYPLDDDGGAAAAPAPAAAAPGDLRARLTAAKPPAIDVAAAAAAGAAASTQRVSPRNRRPPAAAYVPPGRRGAAPAAAAPAGAAPAAAPPIGVAARLGKRPAEAAAPVSDLRAKLSRPAAS